MQLYDSCILKNKTSPYRGRVDWPEATSSINRRAGDYNRSWFLLTDSK